MDHGVGGNGGAMSQTMLVATGESDDITLLESSTANNPVNLDHHRDLEDSKTDTRTNALSQLPLTPQKAQNFQGFQIPSLADNPVNGVTKNPQFELARDSFGFHGIAGREVRQKLVTLANNISREVSRDVSSEGSEGRERKHLGG